MKSFKVYVDGSASVSPYACLGVIAANKKAVLSRLAERGIGASDLARTSRGNYTALFQGRIYSFIKG
jgi:hypothetical protein